MPFSIKDKHAIKMLRQTNPVDYKIWGILQERVYKINITDVGELRHHIGEEWVDQRVIDKAVGQW